MSESRQPGRDDASVGWQRLWDVFHGALETPPESRHAFLDRACGGDTGLRANVEKLLRAHAQIEGEDSLSKKGMLITEGDDPLPVDYKPGDQLGSYVLEAVIGEGGMGVVYRARQNLPVKRHVALKLLRAGIATREVLGRFDAERQALAMMSHTNIAQVYDAGVTETGCPYFAMEYVEGLRVTDYCDRHKLSIGDRLRLFIRICDGVQHAHQKGIIHRDIKPSNVLVVSENGQHVPKIIDFGIAKATEQRLSEETLYTQLGAMIGTPGYMSPEQAGVVDLDVDTRADVYSLGVLLYELLVGLLPFQSVTGSRGLLQLQEAIRDEDPQRPSLRLSTISADELQGLSRDRAMQPNTFRRQLDGDISWVALKAMEKDRAGRYASVAGLMADVRRYLDGMPVLARAPTALYRATRFVRRHRVGVAVTVTIAALTLAFAGLMTVQSLRLQAALAQSESQRERAEQVSDFMVRLFEAANPEHASGEVVTASDMLARGAQQLTTELTDQPELRGRLLATVAETYRVLGGSDNNDEAVDLLQQAVDDLYSLPEPPLGEIARVKTSLGATYHDSGDYENAERQYRQAIDLFRGDGSEDAAGLADALANLGMLNSDRGDLEAAAMLTNESLAFAIESHGERSSEVARTRQRLAYILYRQGEGEGVLPMMLESLAVLKDVHGERHAFVATALNFTATVQRGSGDSRGAQESLREAVEIYRHTHGDDHPYLAATLSNLALAYNGTKDHQLAIDALEEAMRIGIANLGVDHPNVNSFRLNIGTTLQDMGRYAESEPLLREGLARDRIDLDEKSPYLLASIDRLGDLLDGLGAYVEAEALIREALERRIDKDGPGHSDTGVVFRKLAANLTSQGRFEEADDAIQRALEIHRETGPDGVRLAQTTLVLGQLERARGNSARAADVFQEALSLLSEESDEAALAVAAARFELARISEEADDVSAAARDYAEAEEIMRRHLQVTHPNLGKIELAIARIRCRQGEDALQSIATARSRLEDSLGVDNWQHALADAALGECAFRNGDFVTAEARLLASVATLGAALGDDHFMVAEVRRKLDELYDRWGDSPER